MESVRRAGSSAPRLRRNAIARPAEGRGGGTARLLSARGGVGVVCVVWVGGLVGWRLVAGQRARC